MPNKIYAIQTLLTLTFDTGIDLTNMVSADIKYRRGSTVLGTYTGTIDAPATAGIVSFSNYPGTLDPGLYTFWVYLTDTGGKITVSEPVEIYFYPEGY